jgi:hypothetical protein
MKKYLALLLLACQLHAKSYIDLVLPIPDILSDPVSSGALSTPQNSVSAINSKGQVVCAWTQLITDQSLTGAQNQAIYSRLYLSFYNSDLPKPVWSDPIDTGLDGSNPQVGIDSSGHVFLLYKATPSGFTAQIFIQRFTYNPLKKTWSPDLITQVSTSTKRLPTFDSLYPLQLSDSSKSNFSPNLFVNATGQAAIAWLSTSPSVNTTNANEPKLRVFSDGIWSAITPVAIDAAALNNGTFTYSSLKVVLDNPVIIVPPAPITGHLTWQGLRPSAQSSLSVAIYSQSFKINRN